MLIFHQVLVSTLQALHVILAKVPQAPHFTNEEMNAERDKVTYLRFHSKSWSQKQIQILDPEPKLLVSVGMRNSHSHLFSVHRI